MLDATNDVVVVGGGAAGMLAAIMAGRAGARVLLLEKNEKLGKKVYITGKGRCNLTNLAEGEEFFKEVPHNGAFLRSAMHAFSNRDIISLVESYGTRTKVERGQRVFPESDKASDVTRALTRALSEAGVRVCLNTEVRDMEKTEDGFLLSTPEGKLPARAVILATGGISYPSTGSTGDGYRFAGSLGHTVTETYGSLVGLISEEKWPSLLQGLSLRNVRLTAKVGKRQIYDELGEMLFTHFGFSGPLVIELSSHLPEPVADAAIRLDLKPGIPAEELDARLTREFSENARKQLQTVMLSFLPARMAGIFPSLCGADGSMMAGNVPKAVRHRMVDTFKGLPLKVTGRRDVAEAIVTRGGVQVKEITPGTLMSKKVPGLFFAGELLDVDAHTGGFNLQIAWSTGALAGRRAAEYAKEVHDGIQ